jgi:excisionase family DNA binding protein
MPEHTNKETCTVQEVARRLGLHRNTIYQMVRDERCPLRPMRVSSRKILFRTAEVDALLQQTS